jgi:acyl-coenzyme A thioesterase PaaI-like protein
VCCAIIVVVPMSLQEQYAPASICYGCGPANAQGLHVRSIPSGDEVVCDWTPAPHHQAFPGMVNGGILGTILDCHSNWTAAWHLMRLSGAERPPVTLTADYTIILRRPTPSGRTLHLSARVVESTARRAVVEARLSVDGKVTATCRGTFIVAREGHPAAGAWG